MDNNQTQQRLIEENQGLVRSLAASIHKKVPQTVDIDDLTAYGQLGLAEAAQDYDSSRGAQFSTYAYYRIRGAIYDGLSKMMWKVPGQSENKPAQYECREDGQQSSEVLDCTAKEPAVIAIDREISQRIRELIDALPAEAGNLIRTTYYEGLSLQEAGRRLGISKSWASRLHAKTLRSLAQGLTKESSDGVA
jgi:RNA polymerase sigma factor FliA